MECFCDAETKSGLFIKYREGRANFSARIMASSGQERQVTTEESAADATKMLRSIL